MQSYAEGLNVLQHANVGLREQEADAETTPLRDPDHYRYDLDLTAVTEVWRRGSVIASWLLDLTAQALHESPSLDALRRPRERLRRGPLDGAGGGRGGRARARARGLAVRPLLLARRGGVRQPAPVGDAARVRRPSREDSRPVTETAQPSRTEAPQENPLLEGLRMARTPEPCALVIFGASGDLTRRKIMPALYALAYRRLLPEQFGVVGVARTEETDDAFRERMKEAVQEFARDPFRDDVWDSFAEGLHYVGTDFADEGGEDKVVEVLNDLDKRAWHRRQPALLPRDPAGRVLDGRRRDRQAPRHRGLDAARGREAVRARPGLREGAERGAAGALRRERGLPDRPLPRQGDGPEHARAAVLERHLRADLEPPVHRPRADHGGRVDGDRGPRGLLRQRGRDPRHLPEPPAPAARDHGDGAADRLHRRLGAQREGEGAALDAHARAEARRARPVRARVRRGRRGARVPRGAGRPARTR